MSIITSTHAYGKNPCDVNISPGETVPISVPVATQGTTVTFSFPVRDVVASHKFSVEPVGAAKTELGQSKNPKSFLISSTQKIGVTDEVTFFLGSAENDKGTVTLALTATKSGKRAQSICLPDEKKAMASSRTNYVHREMNMMVSMINDEPAYGRQTVSQVVDLKGFQSKIRVRAVRVFRQEDLTGYTFSMTNSTSKTIKLNLTSLSFGKPNQAIMLHSDHDVLEPCSKNKSANPKENGCTTFVHLIVTGNLKPEYLSTQAEFPFITHADKLPK